MYGIPYEWMTPDTFGEKFGSGRLPPGTRGYTWTDWQGWLATDEPTDANFAKENQIKEMKAGVFTLLIVGSALGVILAYHNWKESKKPTPPKSMYSSDGD